MMRGLHLAAHGVLAVGFVLTAEGCAKRVRQVHLTGGSPTVMAELWQAPTDLARRDLFQGVGGARLSPPNTAFTFVARDTSGWSPGFDVKDAAGVEWSVKLGPEAQAEVVSSRLLWAIGFHQPPVYYLERWNLTGAESGVQGPGRFRPDLPGAKVAADWPGTRTRLWDRGSSKG